MAANEVRRYGFFKCEGCSKIWQSSHVYCIGETDKVIYQQDCKNCGKACFPYCVQPLRCSRCGETDCVCSQDGDEDDNSQERHVDPNKPHRGDLCHRCRAGKRCTF